MKYRYLCALSAGLFSLGASASGYWDFRTVCDYETVEIQHPVTHCAYAGQIYSNSRPRQAMQATAQSRLDGHTSCPASHYVTRRSKIWNDNEGRWEFVTFEGQLPLTSQSHDYDITTERRQVEGSCREEAVWIPCEMDTEGNRFCD